MWRIVISSALFMVLIMFNGWSLADTFKCTCPDGSVFFTDDPSRAPGGCVIERVENLPVGVVPDAPMKQPQVPREKSAVAPQTQAAEKQSFESFKREAGLLVEKFQSARHRVVTASFGKDRLAARRELTDIKAQKTDLLTAIEQSSLSNAEKSELAALLSSINE